MNAFFAQHPHPGQMPIEAREMWHRIAWSYEQDALADLAGTDVAEHLEPSRFYPFGMVA